MNQTQDNILNGLQLVKKPTDIDFYPTTIGWKYLMFLTLLFICFVIVKLFFRYRKNKYKRDACRLVRLLYNDNTILVSNKINRISQILKMVAIQSYKDESVKNCYGKQWIDFLQKSCSSYKFNNIKYFFEEYLYYSDSMLTQVEASRFESFVTEVLIWINKHHV